MAINLELYLPPSYTTTVQLYARAGGAAVGSPVSGVPDGGDPTLYVFGFGSIAIGDYDCQLSGVSIPDGPTFPMRVTSTTVYYIGDNWAVIDATIVAGTVVTPSGTASMCNVLCVARRGATALSEAKVVAQLEAQDNAIDDVVISRHPITQTTDINGEATLELVRYVRFTKGGAYRLRMFDGTRIIYDELLQIPNTSSANLEDCVSV